MEIKGQMEAEEELEIKKKHLRNLKVYLCNLAVVCHCVCVKTFFSARLFHGLFYQSCCVNVLYCVFSHIFSICLVDCWWHIVY